MTQANISLGSDAEHAETGATRVGFTDPAVQFFQRVAGICETVLLVLQCVVAVFRGEFGELIEDAVHLMPADVIQPLRTRRGRSKTNGLKADLLREMAVYAAHVADAGRERYAGADRIRTVALQQHLDFRDNDVVAPPAIVKDALAIIEFRVPVHTHGHSYPVFREKFDNIFLQHRAIGWQTELDLLA